MRQKCLKRGTRFTQNQYNYKEDSYPPKLTCILSVTYFSVMHALNFTFVSVKSSKQLFMIFQILRKKIYTGFLPIKLYCVFHLLYGFHCREHKPFTDFTELRDYVLIFQYLFYNYSKVLNTCINLLLWSFLVEMVQGFESLLLQ